MSVMSLLSGRDKSMIEQYIDWYALPDETRRCRNADYILREWDRQKTNWLGEIFKDKLILNEQISFSTPEVEIYHMMNDSAILNFQNHWRYWAKHESIFNFNLQCYLSDLIYVDFLVHNKYEGESFEIPDPSRPGKSIVIPKGCRPVRMIGKIYNLYANHFEDGTDFEAFRIAVSRALNTAKLSGTLCLSIHPMDYMTMSDNECDWESCMSWMQTGSYRQGTVEMMNSPWVVVAYITASTDMNIGTNYTWNNKKWRSLYICAPNFIGNIKGYPYQLPEVDKIVIDRLKNMVWDTWSIKYSDTIKYDYDKTLEAFGKEVLMHTNYMYNDFGTIDHYGCVNFDCNYLDLIKVDPPRRYSYSDQSLTINYSGCSECMACGELGIDVECEEMLVGTCCYYLERCDYCGDNASHLNETGDGTWVCDDCLAEYYGTELYSGEYYRYDDMAEVKVLPDALKDKIDFLSLRQSYNIPCIYDAYNYELDDDESKQRFARRYLKEDDCEIGVVKGRHPWSRSEYYIFQSQLREDWFDKFDRYTIDYYGYDYNKMVKLSNSTYGALKLHFTDESVEKAYLDEVGQHGKLIF